MLDGQGALEGFLGRGEVEVFRAVIMLCSQDCEPKGKLGGALLGQKLMSQWKVSAIATFRFWI